METAQHSSQPEPSFMEELADTWQQLPNKTLFFVSLAAWILLFQYLGNATFGYVDSTSLMYWMFNAYGRWSGDSDDSHGTLIPIVVLVLFWFKRKELLALPNKSWGPGLVILALALALHLIGYRVQQPRVSIVAFFLGIYGLMGLAWGPQWLRKSFFPFFLFVFCIPISSIGEPITFPLRHLVSKIVADTCNTVLGMDVIREGTLLFNSHHTYSYDVAAACSGIRSLIAILALCTIYGFMSFESAWKRILMMLLAFPLAVIGNVARLLCIIITADLAGASAGNFVHENWFFSLVPYIPTMLGIYFVGNWLRDRKESEATPPVPKTA